MVLLISYDLNREERPKAYAKIKDVIEQNAADFVKPLYSQWLVSTHSSPQDWTELLLDSGTIDKDDRLLIIQIKQPYWGWLSKDHWRWLREHV